MGAIKDTKQVGKLVYSKGNLVNIREYANTTSKIVKTAQRVVNGKLTAFGKLTGFYAKMQDGFTWWHIISGTVQGWCRSDVINISSPGATDVQAQSMINELIANNLVIREKLVSMIPILKSLKAQNKLDSNTLKKFREASNRLLIRENELKANKGLSIQTGIKQKINDFMQKWGITSFQISGVDEESEENIQAVPIVVFIVGAVVLVGLGAGIYAYFNKYFGESKADLVITDELQQALNKLDPQTAEAVKQDLQNQIDDSYTKGREDEKQSNGLFGNITPLLYVGGGLFLAKFLMK